MTNFEAPFHLARPNPQGDGAITSPPRRLPGVDAARGVAIVLMIVDHCLAVFEASAGPGWWSMIRLTLTRLALPLFMIAAGVLWSYRGVSTAQGVRVLAVAVVSSLLLHRLGLPPVGILWSFLVAWCAFSGLVVRYPLACIVLGFIQAVNVPHGWFDYQVGYVVAWLALGVLAAPGLVERWQTSCGPASIVDSIGRRPLAWYLGHLVALVVLVESVARI